MVCSCLLHGYDIIRVLKLCREERRKAKFSAQFEDGVTSDPCNKYEQITTYYTLSVLELTYPKPEKK